MPAGQGTQKRLPVALAEKKPGLHFLQVPLLRSAKLVATGA